MAGTSDVILLLDDEPDLAATCERLLRRLGYHVVTVGTCAAALAALGDRTPTLLISDVRLPDGNGLDVVRTAHRLPHPIPAIVMTGHPSESGRRAAIDVGAVYLPKPFSAADFTRLVTRTLDRPTATPP